MAEWPCAVGSGVAVGVSVSAGVGVGVLLLAVWPPPNPRENPGSQNSGPVSYTAANTKEV